MPVPPEGWLEPLPDETLPEPELPEPELWGVGAGVVTLGGEVEGGDGDGEGEGEGEDEGEGDDTGAGAVVTGVVVGAGGLLAGVVVLGAGVLETGAVAVDAEALGDVFAFALGLGLGLGLNATAGGLDTGATRAIVTIGGLTACTGAG